MARERLTALEQSLAEREGLPPAARALAEAGERLALQLLDVAPGSERSVAAALSHRASAIVADTPARALELVVNAMTSGLGSLFVLVGRDPRQLVDLPVVPRDSCSPRRFHRSPRTGSAGTRSAASSGSRARRPRPSCSSSTLGGASSRKRSLNWPPRRSRRASASRRPVSARTAAASAFAPVAHLRRVVRAEPAQLERLVAGAERLDETLRVAASLAARLETPLAERAGRLAEDLRGTAAREGELRRAVGDADVRALAAERRAGGRSAEASGEPDELRTLAEALSARAEQAAAAAEASAERARTAARALADADPGRARRPGELVLGRLLAGAERLEVVAHGRRRPVRSAGTQSRRCAGDAHDRARRSPAPSRRRGGRAAPARIPRRRAAGRDRCRTCPHRRRARRGAVCGFIHRIAWVCFWSLNSNTRGGIRPVRQL